MRFLTGNLGLRFALMLRSVLRPRLLTTRADAKSSRIRAKIRALSSGGNVQDWACLRGFDDFNARFVTEFVWITLSIQRGLRHHFSNKVVG